MNWKSRSAICLLCCLWFLSCSSGNDAPSPHDPDKPDTKWSESVRIATYNLRYYTPNDTENLWEQRKGLLKYVFSNEKFDIFGVQEPYGSQIKDIEPFLTDYEWVGVDARGGNSNSGTNYNAVFYRKDKFEVVTWGSFWYSETPDLAGSLGWDATLPRMCNWVRFRIQKTDREFYLFNSHFHHTGTTARPESAKLLVKKVKEIAGDLPAVCTGDFNSNQNSDAYKTIATSGILVDSYSVCTLKTNAEWPTYNGFSYISEPKANANRIDHIFVTLKETKVASWRIINSSYDRKYPSDHFPVVIELAFAEP